MRILSMDRFCDASQRGATKTPSWSWFASPTRACVAGQQITPPAGPGRPAGRVEDGAASGSQRRVHGAGRQPSPCFTTRHALIARRRGRKAHRRRPRRRPTGRSRLAKFLVTVAGPDQGQSRARVEPPVVEGTPGNGALQQRVLCLQKRLDILDAGKTARGYDGNGGFPGERRGRRQIQPLEHAIARHIGIDDGGDAGVLTAPRQIERRQLAGDRPAFDGNLAVLGVDANSDAPGKRRAACRTSSGSRTAMVPRMTRLTPLSSQASIVARSRMPPPSCTGIPTLFRIAPTAAALTGRPAKAPSRSTRCR